MIGRVHDHITAELNQGARTDTIFVITAIALNLISLAVNSALASESREEGTLLVVMLAFVVLIVVINLVSIVGLQKGKQTRETLMEGLLRMYRDQGVDGYYDPAILGNYRTRYSLFMVTVVCTGLVAIAVPFIVR